MRRRRVLVRKRHVVVSNHQLVDQLVDQLVVSTLPVDWYYKMIAQLQLVWY